MRKIIVVSISVGLVFLMSGFNYKQQSHQARWGRFVVGGLKGYFCTLTPLENEVLQSHNQQIYSGKIPSEFSIFSINKNQQRITHQKEIYMLEKYGSDTDYFSRKWKEALADGQMPTTIQWITSKNKIVYFKNNQYHVCELK
ncbi:MAG: hypothetical protein L6Q37_09255 [Bdellovibrionaceae bacterium]|nr:hypothetical protein [Pseudobdellovibrionaceae bacterium]NUM57821.1 hypothetical protein [Pseudobdellovibrionaceae bacterium]